MAKITLQMIADKLGVSKGLVSIALSDRYGVSQETRSEIVITAIQMGYDFSRIKKQKQSARNNLFYVLTKNIDLQIDRFWPQIIKGIEARATEYNYQITLKPWHDETNFELFVSDIIDMRCSGIIIVSEIPQIIFNHLVLSKIPMILVDGKVIYDDFIDTVSANNYVSYYKLTRYVIEKGHQHLAFVGDIHHAYSFNQRYLGFKDCVNECPQDVIYEEITAKGTDPDLTYSYNLESLERSVKEGLVDAYLCANDNIAEKVYGLAEKYQKRIPDDFSVVGFDDNAHSKFLTPPLTTINVPKRELGQLCFDTLIHRIQNRQASLQRINLMGGIVERASVKTL